MFGTLRVESLDFAIHDLQSLEIWKSSLVCLERPYVADGLTPLLANTFVFVRAIRLLTAEAKRRSTLLRLCGADYENALDKLEAMRALKVCIRTFSGLVAAPSFLNLCRFWLFLVLMLSCALSRVAPTSELHDMYLTML